MIRLSTSGHLERISKQLEELRNTPVLPQRFPPLGQGKFFQDVLHQDTLGIGIAFTTFYTFRVSDGSKAIIASFGVELDLPAGSVDVFWRFVVDGVAEPVSYGAPPYLIGTVDTPSEVLVELDQGNQFEVQFRNASGIQAYIANWRLKWWEVPWYGPGFSGADRQV